MQTNRLIEFWSSVECAGFLRGLLRELNALGWNARHRFAIAENAYREARDPVARWRMRWHSYITYPGLLRRRLRAEPRPAALVVCTNTFYAPAVALRVVAQQPDPIPVLHWVFDLFPDVLIQAGELAANGKLARRLARNTRDTFDRAATNIFLGEHLRAYAERFYGPVNNATVIPIGADAAPFRTTPPAPRSGTSPLRILYCGNLGRMHDIETISGVLTRGLPTGCTLELRGHGTGFTTLAQEFSRTSRVRFGPSLREREWVTAMQSADVALVTLRKDASHLVMPSKTYSAMVAGQAVLAVASRQSDLGEVVARHDAGWIVEPGETAALRAMIAHVVAHPAEVMAKRKNAYEAAHRLYDDSVIARAWDNLLRDTTACVAQPSPSAAASEVVSVVPAAAIAAPAHGSTDVAIV